MVSRTSVSTLGNNNGSMYHIDGSAGDMTARSNASTRSMHSRSSNQIVSQVRNTSRVRIFRLTAFHAVSTRNKCIAILWGITYCSMSSVHVCSIAWYPAQRMCTVQTNTTYPAIYLSHLWDKILLHSLHSLPRSTLFHTLILCNVFNYVGESEGLPGNWPRPPSDPHGVHCRHHRCESPDTP